MVLYATGFNAWSQLQFDSPGVTEPDDIPCFTCVLRDDAIDCVHSFFSYTRVGLENGESRVAGMVPKDHGKSHAAGAGKYASFAEASNGVVVVHDNKTQALHQYTSIHSLLSNTPSHTFPNHPTTTQLVAYATGFAALSPPPTNQVHTWGDERYTACLGREPTPSNPADTPSPVPDLADLPTGPITKLAGGGYLLAALTAGNDLYCWGHAGRCAILDDLSDTPSPVVINDHDILDVAVGDAHMLVLSTDREVYVIGDNANGQLGLPGVSATRAWTRIDVGAVLGPGEFITGVVAGPRSSFLVAGKQPK